MNFKKKLVAIVMSFLLLPNIAHAATKIIPGAKCSKLGLSQSYLGKKYVCTKKSSQLIWVLVPGAQSSQSKITNENNLNSKEITKFSDLVTKYDEIAQAAWSKSVSASNANPLPNYDFEVIVGPNTKPAILNGDYSKLTIKNYLDLIVKLFAKTPPTRKTYLVYSNWSDRNWMTSKLDELCGAKRSCSTDFLKDCDAVNQSCGGAFAATDNNWKIEILSLPSIEAPWKIYTENIGTIEVHEFTHSIQHSLRNSNAPSNTDVIPRWFEEGQANLNQLIFGGYFNNIGKYNTSDIKQVAPSFTFNEFSVNMQAQVSMMKNTPTDKKFFLDFLSADNVSLYSNTPFSQKQIYFYGAAVMQNLRAVKGPQSEMDLIALTSTGKSFEEAFKQIYEIDWNSAKNVLAEVLARQFAF